MKEAVRNDDIYCYDLSGFRGDRRHEIITTTTAVAVMILIKKQSKIRKQKPTR